MGKAREPGLSTMRSGDLKAEQVPGYGAGAFKKLCNCQKQWSKNALGFIGKFLYKSDFDSSCFSVSLFPFQEEEYE